MRLIGLTLCLLLALSSLAFAPAPLPRRDSEAKQKSQERLLRVCSRRLDDLGVKWKQARTEGGHPVVQFVVERPEGKGSMSGGFPIYGDDLPGTLRLVIARVERYLRSPP
jgi:hypothetical protein